MALSTKALTTVARVKLKLNISNTTHDAVLENLIEGVSAFIASFCNRDFEHQTYENKIYNGDDFKKILFLEGQPVTALTSVEYRIGTVSAPGWEAFDPNYFELDPDLDAVLFYGGVPKGKRNIRINYAGGYEIDFDDPENHTLPFDLSDTAENLVVKAFLKRNSHGKSNEAFDGASITWKDQMAQEHVSTLTKYQIQVL
jgi:hypothetical protein